ncbi:hypothetical protein [Novosphingobium sp.]|uniref:hypothetical protein n=1 Tax=Novosphingobium sp. TaxID=1874826 RepID=UPI0035B49686
MNRKIAPLLITATALALGACASDRDGYPSLARRPIERLNTAPEPVATPEVPPAPPGPEVLNRLDVALGRARSADAQFRQHESPTRTAVAAAQGAPVASEAWSVATIAVSDLESARSDAMIALADVDEIYAKARIEGGDTTAIEATRNQILEMVTGQDAVLDSLKDALTQ